MNLPSGTVTFLFTDIEGSTELWETHPDAMRVALDRHNDLLRACIEKCGGWVFKTVGDAFCAVFTDPCGAIESALTSQLALLTLTVDAPGVRLPLKVRMALHTCVVEERDGDYFGQPVNRVARLLATAHGGQVVLSAATQELVRGRLPADAGLRSLGEHRLKDLGRPESISQLLHPELPADFPPLRSLGNWDLKHNLPQQVTSFIGREMQMSEVKGLMEKTRLLTLTGSGGSGKTRLALQVAADMLDGSGDGVWLVDLAPLTDPNLIPSTVANVLTLKEEPGQPILQTLIEHLRNRYLLLILDNCEHLLDACARLVDGLLRSCPRVSILATSREALGVFGETTYRVPSLSLPDPKQPQAPASLSQYEAVRLFIDRAQLHQPQFAVTSQNVPALASICYRLDGIPLAIELAAARVRSLAVEDINAKLDQRFRLLTGGSRAALPRQQTLRSLIDWSYDLLNEAEKELLCRLSVFQGGWNLESAEAACSGDPIEEWELLELLTSLSDKNLSVVEHQEGRTRYRLLETVRQYARDRLMESGVAEVWRRRHLMHFLELAEKAEPELRGPDQAAWLDQLETEHDNLRVALEWSQASAANGEKNPAPDSEIGLRMASSMVLFWLFRGYLTEGRSWLERAGSNCPNAAIAVRAKALNAAGTIAVGQWDYLAAKSFLEEALALWHEIGDQKGVAASLCSLGNLALGQSDCAEARRLYVESLALFREQGNQSGVFGVLNNLACLALAEADYGAAEVCLEECLALARKLGNRIGIAMTLQNLGELAQQRGDYPAAQKLLTESLMLCQEVGNVNSFADLLQNFAELRFHLGDAERGALLWGAAERMRERTGGSASSRQLALQEQAVANARAALGDDTAFDTAWAEGRAMTMAQAIELALEQPQA